MPMDALVRPVAALSPFLHNGLLRVGGRLGGSSLEFDQQHPLILPGDSHLTRLIIDDCHVRNLHTGPALVLSILRQKYWILGGRNAIRFRLKQCNHCFRVNPQNLFPKMADLPACRVNDFFTYRY